MSRRIALCCSLIGAATLAACRSFDIDVVTQHNDVNRTGAYVSETTLTPQALRDRGMRENFRLVPCNKQLSFDDTRVSEPSDRTDQAWVDAKAWLRALPNDAKPCLNGPIITQALYVHGVNFTPKHETAAGVFVTTQWDWVYAVNARTGAWEWATDLLRDNDRAYIQPPCPWRDGKCGTGWLPRGVNATPVIDPGGNRMYVLFSTRLELDVPVNCAGADDGKCRYWHHLVEQADVNYWLVVLDLRSGQELQRTRVGAGVRARKSDGTWLSFDARQQLDRPGLLLDHGSIYIAFGADAGIEGQAQFHGWVMKYGASDLALQATFCTSPNSLRGSGIWQGGGGLAADQRGRVYFLSGNGPSPARLGVTAVLGGPTHPANSFGDSFVKLTSAEGTLTPEAFVPEGADILEENDADLGSGGTLVLPNTNLVIGGGKTGFMYLLDRDSMKLQQAFAASTNLYEPAWRDQCWDGGPHLHGSPTFWNDSLYVWGEKDVLKLYRFDRHTEKFQERTLKVGAAPTAPAGPIAHVASGGMPSGVGGDAGARGGAPAMTPVISGAKDGITGGNRVAPGLDGCFSRNTAFGSAMSNVFPAFQGKIRALAETMPGGMLSVSADGTKSGTGVVWATLPVGNWPTSGPYPGRLYAFDADNLSWLWDAGWGGALSHWVPPTVAEGSVFLATSEYLLGYGLCAADRPCPPTGAPYEPKSSCQSCHSEGRMLDVLRASTMNSDFPNAAAMRAFAAEAFRALTLPEAHSQVLALEGQGVQAFEARPDPERPGKFAWSSTSSTADLLDTSAVDASAATYRRATLSVRFSEGSIWSASDGSSVMGELERTTQPPEPKSAPWALFKVTSRGKPGILSKVTYIKRVHTHAGRAPAIPPQTPNQKAEVAFYAQYWLYE